MDRVLRCIGNVGRVGGGKDTIQRDGNEDVLITSTGDEEVEEIGPAFTKRTSIYELGVCRLGIHPEIVSRMYRTKCSYSVHLS